MALDFSINGESMVLVKGPVGSAIGSLVQLGLSDRSITVTPNFRHKDMNVDAWGDAPVDVQWMLADAFVSMTLIHFDEAILRECVRLSMCGANGVDEGTFGRAGQRLGNNTILRFSPSSYYIGLNIASPVAGKPWRFLYCYLAGQPFSYPLGVEKSVVSLNWRVIPYTHNPYDGGANYTGGGPALLGAFGTVLWDHTMDT